MKNIIACACGEKLAPLAPLLLRLSVGSIFIIHGFPKFLDIAGFAGFLTSLQVPSAILFAYLVAIIEVLGGVLLVFGLFTHWAAKFLTIVMLVALFLVHFKNGFAIQNGGYEFVMLIVATTVSLMVTGAGKWSVDNFLNRKRPTAMPMENSKM